eukprot:Em0001g592a
MEHLKLPNVMDFSTADGISIAEKWQQWQQAMWLYIDLCIDDKPEKDKCKAFLYVIGPAGRDIFTALVLNDDKKDKIDVLFKNCAETGRKWQYYRKTKSNLKMESEKNVTNEYSVTLDVEGVPTRLKVDTGAQANILPWRYYKTLQNRPTLKRTSVKQISYTGDILPTIGQCDLRIKDQCLEFFIINRDQSPILGLKASQTLGLIKVVLNINRTKDIVTCYKGVFQGLGCLQQPYHIKIDSSVQPVVCPVRNQPIALRGRLKEELDKMEELNVIRKIEQPTEWVNSLVVVEKHKAKKLKICLDHGPSTRQYRESIFN